MLAAFLGGCRRVGLHLLTLTLPAVVLTVSASIHVTVYDGVADGWTLLQTETMEASSVNGQLRWKNSRRHW